jgi:hypothetical protein
MAQRLPTIRRAPISPEVQAYQAEVAAIKAEGAATRAAQQQQLGLPTRTWAASQPRQGRPPTVAPERTLMSSSGRLLGR